MVDCPGSWTRAVADRIVLSMHRPELLKEVAPNLHRVALVGNPANPAVVEEVEQIRHIAPKLRLEIETFSLSPSNIDGSLAAISAAGVDATSCRRLIVATGVRVIRSIAGAN